MTIPAPSPGHSLDGALVLVVGARRSGTYWLQRVLSTHPAIVPVPGESHFFSAGIKPLLDRFQHATPASPTIGHLYADRNHLLDATRTFCEAVLAPYLEGTPTGSRLLERTPEHVQAIDVVAELFPDTRFIHIIRDGREATRSLMGQRFGPDDVEGALREWHENVTTGMELGRHVRNYYEVRYEQLHLDPGRVAREIFDFLELPCDDEIARAAELESQLRVNRWKGRRPIRLRRRDQRVIDRIAGGTLAALGYSDPPQEAEVEASPPTRARPPWPRDTAGGRQLVFDQLLERLQPVKPASELDDLLAPGALLEVIDEAGDNVFRSRKNTRGFLDSLATDGVLGQPVRSADRYASECLAMVLNWYGDGAQRLFVVQFGSAGITALHVHRF